MFGRFNSDYGNVVTSPAHIYIAYIIDRYPASNRKYGLCVLCFYVVCVYIAFCIVFQFELQIKNKGYAVIQIFNFVYSVFVNDMLVYFMKNKNK